jgi:hypothetical protein
VVNDVAASLGHESLRGLDSGADPREEDNTRFGSEWVMVARRGHYLAYLKFGAKQIFTNQPPPTERWVWTDAGSKNLNALLRENR